MRKIHLIVFLLVVPMLALAQQPVELFFRNELGLMREKLYLHTDKPYYAAGDTIWFRGTLVNADTHSYLVKTNYIYVELLTPTDSLVTRKKLKRDGLCFHNNIPLEVDLPEGDYYLRGYTEWMRNFDNCYFFSRKISVCNQMNKGKTPVVKSYDYAVTFLPEGGPLLGGVRQRIAFIAQRSDGHSEEVQGKIYIEGGDTLAHFASIHNGMGMVELEVPVGKRVFARTISQTGGEVRTFPLPVAESNAYALKVCSIQDTLLEVSVLSSAGTPLLDGLQVVTHTRGIYTGIYPVKAGTVTIATGAWKDGISQLLLCTATGETLSRRLVFIHNNLHTETWQLKTDRPLYGARERMQIDFTLAGEGWNSLQGDFSVSVTDAHAIEPDLAGDNIVSNLLLNSDLKGEIESPGWYFQDEEGRLEKLDLVMLTHGWSRFDTHNLSVRNEYPLTYAIEAVQYISGHVEGISPDEKNNLISIYNPDDRQFASDVVRPDGTFSLEGLDFPDSTYFGVRLLSKKKYQRKIYIDKPTYPQSGYKQMFVCNQQIPMPERQRYIPEHMTSIMLPDIEVRESRRSRFKTNSGSFYASAWNVQELQALYDPNSLVTVLDFVNHLLETTHAGLIFGHGCTNYLDGADFEQGAVWGPLKSCVVNTDSYTGYDEVYSALSRISLYSVDRIEIHRGAPLGYFQRKNNMSAGTSSMGQHHEIMTADINLSVSDINSLAGGATKSPSCILIRFKPGADYMQQAPDPRKRVVWPKGYAYPAYFYHPAYDTEEKKRQPHDDKRTTLYWNPSVQTDKAGKGSIAFYTSDSPRNYTLTIEGVTIDGKPVYWQQTLF
ncbi:MAG: hypothetical protein IJ467_04695 [Bacteroidaceae bacterium]|nr:hypothetical protein [Bacteroidaceae bacterium]